MRLLLVLVLFIVVGYFGFQYYEKTLPTFSYSQLSIPSKKILGESATNYWEIGKDYLSTVTQGKSEPIINELITKTQETLKDLPKREAEKIKYEFCKDVVENYEK